MRNIVSVDTTYDPIELSYTNCDCDDNTIQLEIFIDSSVSNPYLNVIKNDVTTVIDNLNIINNTIKYELDSSMFYSAGLLQVKVFNEDSNQIANVVFEQEEDYLATDNIIIKISNDTYVIKKVESNKYSDVVNLIYPVGSIYMSINDVNPSTLFGGTWEQLKDTFLLGAGDTYNNGDTGGESEVTLTIDEMPSHTHTYTRSRLFYAEAAGQNAIGYGSNAGTAITAGTNSTGGGLAHNNMPPYLVVNIWKRIS